MDDVDYTPPPEVIEENERTSALTNLGRILVHNEVPTSVGGLAAC